MSDLVLPVVSLFSGIGGLELGACFAGFDLIAAIDNDEVALSCIERGLAAQPICADLSRMDPSQLMYSGRVKDSRQVILVGGPPCTAFSHAGFWIARKRDGADHQVGRIADFLRFIEVLEPRAFLMENVPGLLFKNYRQFFSRFITDSTRLGYTVSYSVLNAADYGVPQRRRRLFIVGIRGKCTPFLFPQPSFSNSLHRGAGWAFADLNEENNPLEKDEALSGKYKSLLPEVPPGENYLYFTKRRGYPAPLFEWRSKYWSFLLKLHPQQPSCTLPAVRVTNNGPFHWDNRHLRVREIARLQTFPDNYPLGNGVEARRQLGNAVPPLLSAQLFMSLREQLGDKVSSERRENLKDALMLGASFSTVSRVLSPVKSIEQEFAA